MAADLNSEKVIIRYLLGDLPEDQQVEVEDRAFQDKEYSAGITAVENDLIDEYIRHELPEADRRRFEERFLASEQRRKRVEFASALASLPVESVAAERTVTSPARVSWRESLAAFFGDLNPTARFAMAAAALAILVGGAWLITETIRLRSQLNRLQADNELRQRQVELERQRNEELTASLSQEKQQREQSDESLRQLTENTESPGPAPPPVIASLTLLPGISRSGAEKPRLALPENARLVRLQIGIDAEEPYETFNVDLRTAAGRQVWTKEKLTATDRRRAKAISLTIPATALKPGEYELRLRGAAEGSGTEDVGFYYFDVTRK